MVKLVDLVGAKLFRATSLQFYRTNPVGVGARLQAGRFNRHGTSALYLSFEMETALKEYFGAEPPTPAVLLPFELNAKNLIEIVPKLGNWPKCWQDWTCDWKAARDLVVAGLADAPCSSWDCAADAIDRKCSGIIYPSIDNPGGKNLVLFMDDATAGAIDCKVNDPYGEIINANPVKRRKSP